MTSPLSLNDLTISTFTLTLDDAFIMTINLIFTLSLIRLLMLRLIYILLISDISLLQQIVFRVVKRYLL